MLGLCYAMTEWRDEALASFDAAIRLNPRYVEAHLNRSIVLSDMGRAEEAAAALHEAHELGRADSTGFPAVVANRLANMHAELGRAYRAAGASEKAVAEFREALALRPAFADLRLDLARTLLEVSAHEPAIAELETILQARPEWVEAMLLRGLAAYLAGDYSGAKAVWEDASERHPEEPRLETYRSMLARKLGARS
jgi:tetratricopeptide (TPR) repeat protein